jgi:guanylate kinase
MLNFGLRSTFTILRNMGTRIGERLRPVVFCGPSGTGKSTLIKRLMNEYPSAFAFSVSHTTRKPREGEKDGREYHFVSREQMLKAVENNEFLEHAEFSGNIYGTSKKAVEDVLSSGRICALDVDIQGVLSLKKTDLNPIYLFIKPPSMDILEKRLRDRGTETDESVRKRLETALRELEYEKKGDLFDHVIVNDNLDLAYEKLKEILKPQIILVTNNNQN